MTRMIAMTDSMTQALPNGPFLTKDLADKVRRTEIAQKLKGVRWRMMVKPNYRAESFYGFLGHAAFPDDVFCLCYVWCG